VESGDFEEYVVARGAALLRTAFLLAGDRHLAEDLVQEALSRVAPRWRRITAKGDPEPYVRRALYTAAVDRSRRRSAAEVVAAAPAEAVAPGDDADAVARRVTLHQALLRLTARQRQVLVLRYYEDLSDAQAAAVMGCSVSTVKSQTVHALGRLRALAPELAETFGRAETTEEVTR
jgi:RNA polymerase sigma-70 factor (sigma-E family)